MIRLSREKPVSVSAVASLFGVHQRTVIKWFGRGLERVKVGGRVYTSLEAIERWSITASETEGSTEDDAEEAAAELSRRFGV